MFLPYLTAVSTEQKLSSVKTISEAFFATSVPVIPIAKPTSALFNAGASFVPSPVTATIEPCSFNPVTSRYLSSGEERASTFNFLVTSLNALTFYTDSVIVPVFASSRRTTGPTNFLNVFPVIHKKPYSFSNKSESPIIPASFAIATAVSILSPVTILTLIPER